METRSLIQKKLDQKPLDSKKALYAIYGAACVLIVFAASAFLILHHAEEAKNIVELANLTILFFGATVTTLLTGQAAMDWKAMSALQHLSQDEKVEEVKVEKTEIQSNQALPQVLVTGSRSPKDFNRDSPI